MASDVIRGMMKQDKRKSHRKSISILGVPHDAVRVFIRFLYSSWLVAKFLTKKKCGFYKSLAINILNVLFLALFV